MKRISIVILLLCIGYATVPMVSAQQLAFPGAQGFGRFATGGRGGTVYHVTNLNDAGSGSFRDAVSQPNRIVVFDVGGVININERIVIHKNIYVAGQTAPGGGITIYGNGVAFNGSSGNSIIRYIRIRMGKNGDSGKDAVAISAGMNYIFDHVSISWGRDGTVDVNGTGIDNLTFQDCIISQGINNSNHSTGGLLQDGRWSMIRSLYHSNKTRNPKARGVHECINSILYNWAEHGYIMGDTEGLSECNLIGNYFIYGPSSNSNSHITGTTPSFNVYAKDNWIDSDKDGVLDGTLLTNYKTATVRSSPFAYPGVGTPLSAQAALTHVINNVGASRTRDAVDQLLINQLKSYGKQGRIINTEDDNGISGNVGTVANGTPPKDTDRDGMSDDWERERGLNPNVADDKGDDDKDGYTNIEEYLSCLVGEGNTCTPVVKKPIKYVYTYDNSGNLSWTNTNSWTPKAVPTEIDTVIIRTGEVQISNLNHTAPMMVESNGILRLVNGNSTVSDLRLQGGTLKLFTSSPEFVLTSNIKVEAPSTVMAGSAAATVFVLNGTISGNADLTKTSVGNLRINSTAAGYKGNWIIAEGKLQLRSTSGLGMCGAQVKGGARLDIEVANASIYSLKIDTTGGVDLDQNFTTSVLVLGKENVLSGSYNNATRPAYIGSTAALTVSNSILTTSGSTNICLGATVQLQTLSSSTYSWKNGTTQVGAAQTYTASAVGDYTVTVSNANACKITSAAVNVGVSSAFTATVSTTSPTTFCSGGSVVLTASTGTSYRWLKGTTQVGTSQTYTATTSGDYTVEVTNASGCKAISSKTTVTVNALPVATVTATITSSEVVLTASAGTSYRWFNGTTQVGTDQTYIATSAGDYTVEVTNANGCKLTSAPLSVIPNQAPEVTITSPATNASFIAPASITINATAADANGTVSNVQFYNGSTLLGSDATSPYSFSWTNVAAGTYTLTARATDNNGAVTTSSAVSVVVNNPTTGTVIQAETACTVNGILSETKNAGYNGSGYVNLDNAIGTAAIWSVNSPTAQTITLGIRYANAGTSSRDMSLQVNNVTQVATVNFPTTGAWTTWSTANVQVTLAAGFNMIKLTSLVSDGAPNIDELTFSSSSVSATSCTPPAVNQAPSVSISSPVNNATFTSPATITISANATDVDGTISNVQFYNGSTLLGSDASSPYSFSWTNVAAGTYTITAKATDDDGAVATSSAITITVTAPVTVNTTIQAETACSVTGILSETKNAGFVGTGYVNVDNAVGTSASWSLTSPVNQTVTLSIRYANASANSRNMSASVNGVTQVSAINFVSTGAWTTWSTINVQLNLIQGINTLKLVSLMSEGGPNIDEFIFSGSVSSAACGSSLKTAAFEETNLMGSSTILPNPSSDAFSLTAQAEVESFKILSNQGVIIYEGKSIEEGQMVQFGDRLKSGLYILQLRYLDGRTESIKIQKL